MTRIELDISSSLPPDRIIAGLTDFTERRPDLWPGLSRNFYHVYSVGETSADVREGTNAGPMTTWARERYDWSSPGSVTWTVQESNFCEPGSYVSASVSPAGHGSDIHIVWERTGVGTRGRLIVWLVKALGGRPIASSIKKGLGRLAAA
jgi:hypothetical protein